MELKAFETWGVTELNVFCMLELQVLQNSKESLFWSWRPSTFRTQRIPWTQGLPFPRTWGVLEMPPVFCKCSTCSVAWKLTYSLFWNSRCARIHVFLEASVFWLLELEVFFNLRDSVSQFFHVLEYKAFHVPNFEVFWKFRHSIFLELEYLWPLRCDRIRHALCSRNWGIPHSETLCVLCSGTCGAPYSETQGVPELEVFHVSKFEGFQNSTSRTPWLLEHRTSWDKLLWNSR